MPSDLNVTIEQHWINTFSDTVYKLTHQIASRLKPLVELEPLGGENRFLDRVGSVEVQKLNTRSPEIIPSDLLWDRRKLNADRVGVAFFMDDRDVKRVLTDPKSIYAVRAAEAHERDFDRAVVAALDATVYTGKDGTTALTAASDGMLTVSAVAGFTYDILLTLDSNFQGYEIGNSSPVQKWLVLSEQEHEQLMKEAELVSRDFTSRMVVDAGNLKQAMDFNLIVFGSKMANPMLTVASSQRSCWAVASGAMRGAVGVRDVKWQPRNDRWDTDQLLAKSERGFVRMEATRVQKITTTAT